MISVDFSHINLVKEIREYNTALSGRVLGIITGRKATFPALVFTKDMQRTGQISYTCLAPVLTIIVENFYDIS